MIEVFFQSSFQGSVLWSPPHISRYVADWISQPLILGRSVDNYLSQADHVIVLALSYLEFKFSKEWVELDVQVLLNPGDPDPSWLRCQPRVIPAVSLLRSHLCHLNPRSVEGLLDLFMYNTWKWVDPWMGLLVRVDPEEDTKQDPVPSSPERTRNVHHLHVI